MKWKKQTYNCCVTFRSKSLWDRKIGTQYSRNNTLLCMNLANRIATWVLVLEMKEMNPEERCPVSYLLFRTVYTCTKHSDCGGQFEIVSHLLQIFMGYPKQFDTDTLIFHVSSLGIGMSVYIWGIGAEEIGCQTTGKYKPWLSKWYFHIKHHLLPSVSLESLCIRNLRLKHREGLGSLGSTKYI